MRPVVSINDDRMKRALPIVQRFNMHGHDAYFVGGCVRDLLLNRPVGDIDIATSATPTKTMQLFERTVPTGIKHGTVTVLDGEEAYEVTTFRTESTYSDSRRPDSVQFHGSLQTDVARRDFTMNALAIDSSGQLLDYVNGQTHIQQRKIVSVGPAYERFLEDALRMLRAVRFSAQLRFEIDRFVIQAIRQVKQHITAVAAERITTEWEKLIAAPYPSVGLAYMLESELVNIAPFSFIQPAIQFVPTLQYFDELHTLERWGLLLSLVRSDMRDSFLAALRLRKQFAKNVRRLSDTVIKYRFVSIKELDDLQLVEIGENDAISVQRIQDTLQNRAFSIQHTKEIHMRFIRFPIRYPSELDLDMKSVVARVNKRPGPWIKRMRRVLFAAVLAGSVQNNPNELEQYAIRSRDQWEESDGESHS